MLNGSHFQPLQEQWGGGGGGRRVGDSESRDSNFKVIQPKSTNAVMGNHTVANAKKKSERCQKGMIVCRAFVSNVSLTADSPFANPLRQ